MTETIEVPGDEYDVVLLPEEQKHIVYPRVPEDLKALALCGKKWKPSTYAPSADVFMCPDCVDVAVELLVEADGALVSILQEFTKVVDAATRLNNITASAMDTVLSATPALNVVVDEGHEYAEKQEAKALAKLQRRMEKEAAKAEAIDKPKKKKGKKKK